MILKKISFDPQINENLIKGAFRKFEIFEMEIDHNFNLHYIMSAQGISPIYFLIQKGKIIILRNYRGDCGANITDKLNLFLQFWIGAFRKFLNAPKIFIIWTKVLSQILRIYAVKEHQKLHLDASFSFSRSIINNR